MLLGVLGAVTLHAEERSSAKPPFTIGGFRYVRMPPHTHMNVCEVASCTPGSKVSYILLAPGPAPSLKRYRSERRMIAEALRKRAAPGTIITFDTPQRTKDKLFTILKAPRMEAYPDGRKRYFLSQRLHSAHLSADIISSAPSKKAAEDNVKVFMLAIMLLSARAEMTRKH